MTLSLDELLHLLPKGFAHSPLRLPCQSAAHNYSAAMLSISRRAAAHRARNLRDQATPPALALSQVVGRLTAAKTRLRSPPAGYRCGMKSFATTR
jgi:hypothetical protein